MTTLANNLPLPAENVPLRVDDGGTLRIGDSRITLDLVVEQYENGMTPEEMVRAYDTLDLADVYSVVAYYLRHSDDVRAYMAVREEAAAALKAKLESERPRISKVELQQRQLHSRSLS